MSTNSSEQKVSVVVIGRNEGDRLAQCLEALLQEARDSEHILEMIYVDSQSTDNSVAIAQDLNLRTHQLAGAPSAAAARNAGWKLSKGDLILFLDGDSILQPNFLSRAVDAFTMPNVAVVYGRCRELQPYRSIYSRACDLDWQMFPPGPVPYCGGNALIRRASLSTVSGFDEALTAGEEPELCRRLTETGFTVVCLPIDMVTHDLGEFSLKDYWHRAYRTGHAYSTVSIDAHQHGTIQWRSKGWRDTLHAACILLVSLVTLATSFFAQSTSPFVAVCALTALVVLRTVWKSRWKQGTLPTRLVYALHCYAVKIPIAAGFLWGRFSRKPSEGAI